MFTAAFWRDLAERTVRTGAQSAISLLPASLVGLLAFDWRGAALTVGTAVAACVLMGLVSAPVNSPNSASFLPAGRHER